MAWFAPRTNVGSRSDPLLSSRLLGEVPPKLLASFAVERPILLAVMHYRVPLERRAGNGNLFIHLLPGVTLPIRLVDSGERYKAVSYTQPESPRQSETCDAE